MKLKRITQVTTIMALFLIIGNTQVLGKACNNQSFDDFYEAVQHAGAGDPAYVRYDKTPDNYGPFTNDCLNPYANGTCIEGYGKRYKLIATSGVTKKWSAAVCIKVRQNNYWYNYEHRVFDDDNPIWFGPRVSFQYKDSDGRWRLLKGNNGKFASWNVQDGLYWYRWKWSSNTARQYRIAIEESMLFDEYDIAMDW
ncbi:hypothetical protein [Pseudobacteriovorax antillogorgiicola]|uniref:Uncharacterized protein n=1 Tax=Pseudobacteriovorax antillogorgiicola TaxID=1513793 RepID=A0A1Y6CEF6_9BACT|nr:hypothetical protein [Pseudobacteriovorax antillogorgiicola]TCS47619.1 hypothetical protein EDD56_12060 [Pseudobacteriovorax antillogorgiicola]SMF60038.1 hypothetical protein SAMN06296036_12080 [Pseudobacteriovorax antillogorgiicola]